MLKNIRIGTKLFGSFLIVLALLAGLGVFALAKLAAVNATIQVVTGDSMPSVRAILYANAHMNRIRALEYKAVVEGPSEVADVDKEAAAKITDLERANAEYGKLISDAEERAIFDA
jgi:methyl-accepting chemotaxis protein